MLAAAVTGLPLRCLTRGADLPESAVRYPQLLEAAVPMPHLHRLSRGVHLPEAAVP